MLWKAYFVLMAVLMLVAIYYNTMVIEIGIWSVFNFLIVGIALQGLHGYIWNRRHRSPKFWKWFLPFFIASTFFYRQILPVIEGPFAQSVAIRMTWHPLWLLAWLIDVPLFIALYRYPRTLLSQVSKP